MRLRSLAPLLLTSALAACSETSTGDGGLGAPDARAADASAVDGAASSDAALDAGAAPDAEVASDASAAADASLGTDASTALDASAALDAGAPAVRGTCTSASDCGGEPCLALPSGALGWHTCAAVLPPQATACAGEGFDQCCDASGCTAGANGGCWGGPLFYCGGARPPEGNVCVYDACTDDDACTPAGGGGVGLCVPARAFGEHGARCTVGDCRLDADCAARAGGRCLPFFSPCNRRLEAFHCTYDDSPCRTDADCASTPMGYCAPGADGATSCQQFLPPP